MKKLLPLLVAYIVCLNATSQIINQISDKWQISEGKGIQKGMGRLNLNFPDGVEWSVDIYNSAKKFITNHSIKDQRNAADTKKYYDLSPGTYHFKLNTVMVENVPIEEGKETRLKAGVLDISTTGRWELRSETRVKFLTSGNTPKKMALPVGKYQLKEVNIQRVVEIKDVLANVTNETANFLDKWVITQPNAPASTTKKEVGYLDLNFPAGTQWTLKIQKQGTPVTVLRSYEKGNPTYPLSPGHYSISINNVLLENVPIEIGKLTRIKTGRVSIKILGDASTEYASPPYASWITNWYVFPRDKNYNNYFFMGANSENIILPVGSYGLKVWGSFPLNELNLNDGETRDLTVLNTRLTIISENLTWSLLDPDPENPYAVNPAFTKPYHEGGNLNSQVTKVIYLPVGKYVLNWMLPGSTQPLRAAIELIPQSTNESIIPGNSIRINGQGYSIQQ